MCYRTELIISDSNLLSMEKLPNELDLALRLIASKKEIDLRKPYLQRLLAMGYISETFFGDFKINGKGRHYLREHATP